MVNTVWYVLSAKLSHFTISRKHELISGNKNLYPDSNVLFGITLGLCRTTEPLSGPNNQFITKAGIGMKAGRQSIDANCFVNSSLVTGCGEEKMSTPETLSFSNAWIKMPTTSEMWIQETNCLPLAVTPKAKKSTFYSSNFKTWLQWRSQTRDHPSTDPANAWLYPGNYIYNFKNMKFYYL